MCLFRSAHPECRGESFRDIRYGDCFPCSLRWEKPQWLREGGGRLPDAVVLRTVTADPLLSIRVLPWPREDEGSAPKGCEEHGLPVASSP